MMKPCPCEKTVTTVVVTGGHDFQREAFFDVFQSFDDVLFIEALQQDESELFEDISNWPYDVIVLYNMTQRISPKRRANFIQLLDEGVGLVALHHSLASFQEWPEYKKIIGGRYYLKETQEEGVTYQPGTYQHGVDLTVQVADRHHPITQGLDDFLIHDETYNKCAFEQDNHILLSTNHPENNDLVGWARNYKSARVCYLQLGHDNDAYKNENYRRLLKQAIKWCAKKNNSP